MAGYEDAMTSIKKEKVLKFYFDPRTSEQTKEVFKDVLARKVWLIYRPWHLIDDDFHAACLRFSHRYRLREPKSREAFIECFDQEFFGYTIPGNTTKDFLWWAWQQPERLWSIVDEQSK